MIKITTLENGFRIGTDLMKDVETVTVSLAILVGSRFEEKAQSGISHFLEHMAFKGTATRTAFDIAKSIEAIGGYVNAYTSKETTVYYVKVLKEHLEIGIDILSDIIQNSSFAEEEIEKEREVILQELANSEDTPDDIVFEYYYETLFKDQALGRPIIGNRETIKSFKRADLTNYINTKYNAGNMVLSVAGNAEHEKVVELASKFFNKLNPAKETNHEKATYNGGNLIKSNKELTQVQFILGHKGYSLYDDKVYALKIANNILGGGMSSRLFQEIREKRGLVYTVSSFESSFSDAGIFGVYAGTSPEKVNELQEVLDKELVKITEEAKPEELEKTINQIKAGLLMAQESTSARSQRLASNLLVRKRYVPNDEIIAKFEAVKKSQIQEVMQEVIASPKTLVMYGNI